jgi:hypothetical protein
MLIVFKDKWNKWNLSKGRSILFNPLLKVKIGTIGAWKGWGPTRRLGSGTHEGTREAVPPGVQGPRQQSRGTAFTVLSSTWRSRPFTFEGAILI